MQGLIVPRRFTMQPQYACGIDWANPITRGLVFAWLPGAGIMSPYATWQTANNTQAGSGPFGRTLKSSDGTNGINYTTPVAGPPSTGVSHLYVGAVDTTQVYEVANFSPWGTFRVHASQISVGNCTGSQVYLAKFTAGSSGGVQNVYVGRCDVAAVNTALLINGVAATPNSYSIDGTAFNANNIGILQSRIGDVNSQTGWQAPAANQATWARMLSDAELLSLSRNPWQIYRPLLC